MRQLFDRAPRWVQNTVIVITTIIQIIGFIVLLGIVAETHRDLERRGRLQALVARHLGIPQAEIDAALKDSD